MKNVAIILAGGKGKRMGGNVSKQFIIVKDKPIIVHTIEAFKKSKLIDEIVVVLPEDEIKYFQEKILDEFNIKVSKIVSGGTERQHSVLNALRAIEGKCDIVLIHDGARPLVSEDIIKNGITNARIHLAAAPGVMPKDTIKVKEDNFSKETLIRNNLVAVQTPQCFEYSLIRECHERVSKNNINVTDDTMVVELYGNKVYLYEGSYENIKITTKEDLLLFEALI